MSFYGFNFQNNPNFSRLFGQNTMQNAQNAYGQGMQQFTPFNARQDGKAYLDKMRASRTPVAQPMAQPQPTGWRVGFDGRLVDVNDLNSYSRYIADYRSQGKSGGDRLQSGHVLNWLNKAKNKGVDGGYFGEENYKNFGLTPFAR